MPVQYNNRPKKNSPKCHFDQREKSFDGNKWFELYLQSWYPSLENFGRGDRTWPAAANQFNSGEPALFDPRIHAFAHLLTNYCIQTRKNDRVLIEGTSRAEPLVLALVKEILEAGGLPHVLMEPVRYREVFLKYAQEHQLTSPHAFRLYGYREFESKIYIQSITNTRDLNSIDPKTRALLYQGLNPIYEAQFNREAEGKFKRVSTLFPTSGIAQEANMSLADFEDMFYQACHVHDPADDPEHFWQNKKQENSAYLDALKGRKTVHLLGPNADLTFSIDGRRFISSNGRRNMPDGEIFTGPVENSAEGWVRFSYPSIHFGVEVSGIELRFKDGEVTDCSAAVGEETLQSRLGMDEGAKHLGEFGIGTNYGLTRPTGQILLDEKIGGSIHLALGRGYPKTGGVNESAIHWDLITDFSSDAQIEFDGEVLYKDGKFVL